MASYGAGPGLALRQRRTSRTIEWPGGVLPSAAILTRASPAARTASDGLIAIAGADMARFDHDPVTLAERGLLIEAAATNFMLRSDAMDVAPWTAPGATIASNVAVAPTGATSADKLIESATLAQHYLRQTVTGDIVVGSTYVFSFYAKAVERSALLVRITGSTVFAQSFFDLSSVAVTTVTTGGATIAPVGGGWSRVAISGISDATTLDCRIFLVNGTSNYTGDGSSGTLIHGVQVEAGASPTSPIVTATAPATRAADALALDWRARGVPDGAASIRYTFDDGTTQDVATVIAGGVAAVPVTLSRSRVVRAALV